MIKTDYTLRRVVIVVGDSNKNKMSTGQHNSPHGRTLNDEENSASKASCLRFRKVQQVVFQCHDHEFVYLKLGRYSMQNRTH